MFLLGLYIYVEYTIHSIHYSARHYNGDISCIIIGRMGDHSL